MNKVLISFLILVVTSIPVAMAKPPLPRANSVAPAVPLLTKAALKRDLRWTIAYKQKPVYAGKLMTKQERRAFIQAMRMARTVEARQQIREFTYARLRQRAAARGLYVIMPAATTAHTVTRTEAKPQLREVMREPVRVAANPVPKAVAPVHIAPAAVPHPVAPAPRPVAPAAHPMRLPPPPKH